MIYPFTIKEVFHLQENLKFSFYLIKIFFKKSTKTDSNFEDLKNKKKTT